MGGSGEGYGSGGMKNNRTPAGEGPAIMLPDRNSGEDGGRGGGTQ